MKIYIAGKITGLDEAETGAKFAKAEEMLEALGHEPVNPMRVVDQRPGRAYEDYLKDALGHLVTCQGIYLLPDWYESKGATLEHHIACQTNMHKIFECKDEEGRVFYMGDRKQRIGHNAFRNEVTEISAPAA